MRLKAAHSTAQGQRPGDTGPARPARANGPRFLFLAATSANLSGRKQHRPGLCTCKATAIRCRPPCFSPLTLVCNVAPCLTLKNHGVDSPWFARSGSVFETRKDMVSCLDLFLSVLQWLTSFSRSSRRLLPRLTNPRVPQVTTIIEFAITARAQVAKVV
jgi:hypothetical protein